MCQETWNMDHDIKLSCSSGEICKLNIHKYFKTVSKMERNITHLRLADFAILFPPRSVMNTKEAIYLCDKCIFFMCFDILEEFYFVRDVLLITMLLFRTCEFLFTLNLL